MLGNSLGFQALRTWSKKSSLSSIQVSFPSSSSSSEPEMYSAFHSLEKGLGREDLQGALEGTNLPGDACLVLTTDPKPRLRWTAELHERFVDAVTQLGGPDSELGKQSCKEFTDNSKEESQGTTSSSSSKLASQDMNEGYQVTEALRVHMEVQRRLHEQLEVQKHLQLRIEAQGKYLQSILEKACKALADQTVASAGLEAARQELSALVIKVSNGCLSAPSEFLNLPILPEMASVCVDDKKLNRQAQMADCSADSCATSNESSAGAPLQSGGKKRLRPMYCEGDSLVWEGEARQDPQWMTPL
ncbi:hypothetical protein AMTRI_Chr06g175750 [Amborella trichopoda]